MTLHRRFLLAGSAAALAGCSATAALNALVPWRERLARDGVPYGPDPRQRLDVYLPAEIGPRTPLVVFFYGGSWTRGERTDYRFVGEALASGGVAAVIPDYRLSPSVGWRDILDDCAAATQWAWREAPALGLSREQLSLMGHSAGAYNAAMLALDARWLAARQLQPRQIGRWVGIAGPYDFLPIVDPDAQRAFAWPDTPADSQPIRHAGAGAPRTLLIAARDDRTVNPQRNSAALAQRLREAGVPVTLELLDGVNHVTVLGALATPLRRLAPVRERVLAFLQG